MLLAPSADAFEPGDASPGAFSGKRRAAPTGLDPRGGRAARIQTPGALSTAPPRFAVHPVGDPARAEVEAFIASVYAARYGARVTQFAPVLVSLRDGATLVAAAGYRRATQPLFVEHYLDDPVEALLGRAVGEPPARAGIVEVGHLAACRAGEGRRLILRLAQHFAADGVTWVISTLTAELRHLFTRLGIAPLALATADPARLGAAARDWGRYYEHHPLVLAGHLPMAMRRLAGKLASAPHVLAPHDGDAA